MEKLFELLYTYYPINYHPHRSDYCQTVQIKRLEALLHQIQEEDLYNLTSCWNQLKGEVEAIFTNIRIQTYSLYSINTPSQIIEFYLPIDHLSYYIRFYISLLAPYYYVRICTNPLVNSIEAHEEALLKKLLPIVKKYSKDSDKQLIDGNEVIKIFVDLITFHGDELNVTIDDPEVNHIVKKMTKELDGYFLKELKIEECPPTVQSLSRVMQQLIETVYVSYQILPNEIALQKVPEIKDFRHPMEEASVYNLLFNQID